MQIKNKISSLLLVICINIVPFLNAQTEKVSLENARDLEKEGKTEQALVIYEEWLKLHKNDPRVYNILTHIAELENNSFDLLKILIVYAPLVEDPVKRNILFRDIALLWEMLGRVEYALDYYKLAYNDLNYCQKDIFLLNPAKLLIEQGRFTEAESWIKKIIPHITDKDIMAESYFLLAEINISLEKMEKAHSYLILVKNKYPDSVTYPKCLLNLIKIYILYNTQEKIDLILSELEEKFRNSPEYELALSILNNKPGNVVFSPAPHQVIGAEEVYTSDPVEKSSSNIVANKEAEKQESVLVFIQVGSYTMLENAEYMVKELIEKGFRAQIVKKKISGTVYYRVVVGEPSPEEVAQVLLTKLKGAGYEGYLISAEL